MKLLKTALCALALTAGIGATAQVKQTDETRIGEWLIIEEYEIKDNDATVSRQTKVQVGDKKFSTPRRRMRAHYPTYYMGFSRLSNDPFSMDYANGISQNQSKCWDWGVYLCEHSIAFNKRGTFGLSYAFGFGRSSYKFNDGEYFYNDNGLINYGINPANTSQYDETWFRYWGFRLPINLELQHYAGGKPFFLTFGPEIEFRFAPKSLGRIDGGKQRNISKNYDLNPLNVNLMAQVGYNNIGFIAKLSLIDMFQNPARPESLVGGEGMSLINCEVYPLTLGFSIFY